MIILIEEAIHLMDLYDISMKSEGARECIFSEINIDVIVRVCCLQSKLCKASMMNKGGEKKERKEKIEVEVLWL